MHTGRPAPDGQMAAANSVNTAAGRSCGLVSVASLWWPPFIEASLRSPTRRVYPRRGSSGKPTSIWTLSGGERQRVLLARALAQRPRLLVLDELTNHLDIRARFELLDLVRASGVTALAVLHDLDLAVRYCDELVVLDHGVVASAGPVLDALSSEVLHAVFKVAGRVERHPDGVIRITYTAKPLTDHTLDVGP